jgi:low affinity Fe/Cu permease
MADRKFWFVHFAQWVSHITGRPLTFLLALASIVVWAMLGRSSASAIPGSS